MSEWWFTSPGAVAGSIFCVVRESEIVSYRVGTKNLVMVNSAFHLFGVTIPSTGFSGRVNGEARSLLCRVADNTL